MDKRVDKNCSMEKKNGEKEMKRKNEGSERKKKRKTFFFQFLE